jgi:hypothetical protein
LDDTNKILGDLARHHNHALEDLQKNAWIKQIEILKKVASSLYEGYFSLIHQETLPNTLNSYALHSLEFALKSDDVVCKKILQRHISLHEKIFETINKENL